MKIAILLILIACTFSNSYSQNVITGKVSSKGKVQENINVKIVGTNKTTKTDQAGWYQIINVQSGLVELQFSGINYQSKRIKAQVQNDTLRLNVEISETESNLNDVVITGVNRATSLRKSPVPIAVLSKKQWIKT